MSVFYHIKDITLGTPSHSSGHVTYAGAVYNPPNKLIKPFKVIYKKNKYGQSQFSRLEVMFSKLAQLFLSADSTPSLHLVVDNEKKINNKHITGLAVEHLCYVIEKKEGLQKNFYTLQNPKTVPNFEALKVNKAKNIPYYFLDKLPQGFFANLVKAENNGSLTIDYESLASIFTTAYTMEEDDLHKGNYGFYLVEREGKPQAVFFKIDHDLMFVNSIMSFHTRRPFHLLHGAHAFDITEQDLLSLTCLNNSSNSYWPTKFGYISNPFDNKEYHNYAEIDAFARLGIHPNFIKGKWKFFFKHILISNKLIEKTLEECADKNKAIDRAYIALITQATSARLACLRAVLFSIKEFRDYVKDLNKDDTQALLKEVIPSYLFHESISLQVHESFTHYQDLCKTQSGFVTGDTPLHTAIKLGEYRYDETLSMFVQFIDVKNALGKTPLDVALELFHSKENNPTDVRKNALFIMKHLLENGARKTKKYRESEIDSTVKAYEFINPYKNEISAEMHYRHFKDILRDIGEDHSFSLKFKKNLALDCIRRFIEVNEDHPRCENRLQRLRDDLNAYSSEEESAGVKYIRQLRSQLRGMYGLTSTLWEINKMISLALEHLQTKESRSYSFFSCSARLGTLNISELNADSDINTKSIYF
ncbi:MAG: ankyrin repeat domain-containing protein [Legionella longbeachae]|nr:ankyrin repeat domain-containing protein [Legionella longbeachae]